MLKCDMVLCHTEPPVDSRQVGVAAQSSSESRLALAATPLILLVKRISRCPICPAVCARHDDGLGMGYLPVLLVFHSPALLAAMTA
jgi:hypothetical protein